MKFLKIFLPFIFLVLSGNILSAQNVYVIKADSVKITNCDSSELIIENHTQGVPGFLFNTGNGRTIFKKSLIKISDSFYIIGADTLKIPLSQYWSLSGNAGTVDGTNFIGTTDNRPLNFRVNNVKAGRIDSANLSVSLGFQANSTSTATKWNTAIGHQALKNNTSHLNTAVGTFSLLANTSGHTNSAVGYNTLSANTTGSGNLALGYGALLFNTTGSGNIGVGTNTLLNNAVGSGHIAIGTAALSDDSIGYGNVSIGLASAEFLGSGSSNVFIGDSCAKDLVSGSFNTIIGAHVIGLSAGLYSNVIIADGKGRRRINVDSSGNFGLNTPVSAALFQLNQPSIGLGTVSNSSGSTTLSGTNTRFTATFQVGDSITILGQTVVVSAIPSDISMTTGTLASSHVNAPYTLTNPARVQVNVDGSVGIRVSPTSRLDVSGLNGYAQFRLRKSYTPTSTADTNGNTGDFSWDDNYLYMKTTAGWKRTGWSTF